MISVGFYLGGIIGWLRVNVIWVFICSGESIVCVDIVIVCIGLVSDIFLVCEIY